MKKSKTITPLGQRIREAREAAGLTQAELAEQIGLPRGQTGISQIERTDKHVKDWRIIQSIRDVLGIA